MSEERDRIEELLAMTNLGREALIMPYKEKITELLKENERLEQKIRDQDRRLMIQERIGRVVSAIADLIADDDLIARFRSAE